MSFLFFAPVSVPLLSSRYEGNRYVAFCSRLCRPRDVMYGCLKMEGDKRIGKITLVGVGPGDVGYVSQAAKTALQEADVILYDRLIGDDILSLAQSDAKVEAVGKARGIRKGSQATLNERMVSLAHSGLHVVRVKGGDVSTFARLASELRAARAARVHIKIVPGVTTASAVAAALGFPLTEAGVADGVCLLSGHEGAPWISPLLLRHLTLAIYMGLQELEALLLRLAHPTDSNIPGDINCSNIAAVAVHAVSTPQQKIVWGTIGTLSSKVREEKLQSPTIVIIGEVVRLANDWPYEKLTDHFSENDTN